MKHLIYPLITLLLIVTYSCETEIPDNDTTPPQFSFKITGDGFDYTFNQDDDFENVILNLKNGTSYDFIFIGSDDGGVKTIQWQIPPSDYIEFGSAINSPWTMSDPPARLIEWQGDDNNPLTSNLLVGDFEANGEDVRVNFYFFVSNFSGENTARAVSKRLRLNIDNHNTTEIVEFINQ